MKRANSVNATPTRRYGSAAVLAIVLLVLTAAIGGCRGKGQEEEGEEKKVAVHAAEAQRRAIRQSLSALGCFEALLDRGGVVTPAVEGQVSEILVTQGQRVSAGDPIVQLDARIAEANMIEKEAALDAAEASLELLRALPRPEEQENYKLAIEAAAVAVAKAEAVAEKLRPLAKRGEISQQQMFEAELAVKQARLQQQTAEGLFAVALLGPKPEAVAEAEARVAMAEAALASAQTQLKLHTIVSPSDGVVDSLSCRLGQTLAPGTPIGEVVDARQVYALVWLPAADARLVRVGQSAEVTMREWRKGPAGNNAAQHQQPIAGEVVFVGQIVDPQTGNLPVRVLVEDAAAAAAGVVLGQTVAVEIIVAEKAAALAVPIRAIEDIGHGPVLSVVRDDKSVELHPRVGVRGTDWVEVLDTDLKAGEPVILEGYNVPDGTEVRVIPAEEEGREAAGEPHTGASQ